MECSSRDQGNSQTKGMSQLLSEGKTFVAPLEGLPWVAQMPQGQGALRLGGDAKVKRGMAYG
jgi:hypothetical protein